MLIFVYFQSEKVQLKLPKLVVRSILYTCALFLYISTILRIYNIISI